VSAMRPHVVQAACVLLHVDERFATSLFARDPKAPHPWLLPDELALLLRMDPRAFRTDPERPLRLLAALLEEFPVSCALAGPERWQAFTSSSLFHNAVVRGRLVVDAFGDWLYPCALGAAQLELAIALARRRRPRRGTELARAPGVEVARVPAGALALLQAGRASLGPVPHEAVARGARLQAPAHLPDVLECLLVVDGADGPQISPCSDELFSLLSFAREGRTRAALVDEAARLGAGAEADAVVDDLIRDALLAPHALPAV
jgi:hypothetical protein